MLCIGYARSDGRVGGEYHRRAFNIEGAVFETPTPTLVSLASTLPARGREKKAPAPD
jgi:hypothetical protein